MKIRFLSGWWIMPALLLSLLLVSAVVRAVEYVPVTWTWTEPVARTDGSPLAPSEIAGYDLQMTGPVPYNFTQTLIFPAGQTSTTVSLPVGNTIDFSLRTVDTDGRVSEWSIPVSKTVQTPPLPPITECQP